MHGWLVDPQDAGYAFIRPLSYNQLVDKELERISSTGMRSPPRAKLFVQGSPSMAKLSLNSELSSGNIAGPSNVNKRNSDKINESSDNTANQSFQSNPPMATDLSNKDNHLSDVTASASSTPVKSNSTVDTPDKATQGIKTCRVAYYSRIPVYYSVVGRTIS